MEDAAFCHRCGKPQRELAPEVIEPEVPAAAAALVPDELMRPPAPAPPVSFTNSVAVRVGFLTASISSILIETPVLGLLFMVWSALAGYFSVVLYRKRTGEKLSVREGAKLGWITGILNSLIVMVFFTLNVVIMNSEPITQYHEKLKELRAADPNSYAAIGSVIESPYFIAGTLLILFFLFVAILTVFGITGGALSARMARKQEAPHTN